MAKPNVTPTAPATPSAPAETAPAAPSYDEVDIPALTRASDKAPNPHLDGVKTLAANVDSDGRSTKAYAITVKGDKGEAQDKAVNALKRQLADAGKTAGVSVRSSVEDGKVTFWTVKRITRPRKDAETPAETPAK